MAGGYSNLFLEGVLVTQFHWNPKEVQIWAWQVPSKSVHVCRQHFNQFKEVRDNSIKYFPHWPAVFEAL